MDTTDGASTGDRPRTTFRSGGSQFVRLGDRADPHRVYLAVDPASVRGEPEPWPSGIDDGPEADAHFAVRQALGSEEVSYDLLAWLERQEQWSLVTFGPGQRVAAHIDHIEKELVEIAEEPHSLTEWIDVVVLALDGAWRQGFTAEQIGEELFAKQVRNMSRRWPDWRTQPEDKAIEHIRTGEVA